MPRVITHRRRSSVNFRGHKIFARKICIKNQQNARILHDSCPKNYQNTQIFMIFARKNYKIPKFCMIFAQKMPKFYIVIDRKIFFRNFRGACAHPAPSPTVMYCTVDKQHRRNSAKGVTEYRLLRNHACQTVMTHSQNC